MIWKDARGKNDGESVLIIPSFFNLSVWMYWSIIQNYYSNEVNKSVTSNKNTINAIKQVGIHMVKQHTELDKEMHFTLFQSYF